MWHILIKVVDKGVTESIGPEGWIEASLDSHGDSANLRWPLMSQTGRGTSLWSAGRFLGISSHQDHIALCSRNASCSQVAYFIWCCLGEYFGDDCLQAVQISHCLSECWRIMNLGVLRRQFDPFDGKCLFAFDQRIPIIWEIGFLVSWEGSVWGFAFLFSWRFKIVVWLYKWPGLFSFSLCRSSYGVCFVNHFPRVFLWFNRSSLPSLGNQAVSSVSQAHVLPSLSSWTSGHFDCAPTGRRKILPCQTPSACRQWSCWALRTVPCGWALCPSLPQVWRLIQSPPARLSAQALSPSLHHWLSSSNTSQTSDVTFLVERAAVLQRWKRDISMCQALIPGARETRWLLPHS